MFTFFAPLLLYHRPVQFIQSLIDSLGRPHGALDVEGAHVLPVLLEQRDEEVDSQDDVSLQLVLGHFHVANAHSKTQNLKYGEKGCTILCIFFIWEFTTRSFNKVAQV